MATVEVISSGTGLTETERLQNAAAAAASNGASLLFAANRTTSGLTDVAAVQGLITDTAQSAYKGALVVATADNAAPTERMRIDSAGNVGIGINNPTAVLNIKGTGSDNWRGIVVQDTTTNNAEKGAMAIVGAREVNANRHFLCLALGMAMTSSQVRGVRF
jgi:hypothetical protein